MITRDKLDWYSKIKKELKTDGLPIDDISKLGLIASNVSKLFGYNPTLVADALSNLQSLSRDCEWYEERIREEKDEVAGLLNQRSSLQRDVQSCNQTLAAYGNLCDMGFGPKELGLLCYTIHKIAGTNNISKEDAINKFFKDIEDYDSKLGFESKKDKLQQEVNDLNQKKLEWFALVHTAFPKLAVAIAKLISVDGNNKNIAEEFSLLVDLVLKADSVGSFIQKLTSYPVAVAGADGYQSPVFSSKNSNNNGINVGKTRNTGISLIHEPKADHCGNNSNNANTDGKNNQDQKVWDVPSDIYLQKNTQLALSKGGVSIESRHFTSTLFSVYCILSLALRLLVKNNTLVKGRKEEQQQLIPKAIKSAEEQDIELREQQLRQYIERLQPYEIKVPDFKVFHNTD